MPTPQYEDVYEPPILDATGQAIANAIQGLNPPVASFISDAFSVERSYSTGDIVIYENKVYKFTSDKSAGAWDSTKVTETTIGAICSATNASLTNYIKRKFITIPSSTASGTYLTNDITVDDGYSFLCVTQCLGQGFVPTIPIMVDDDTKRLWYQGTIPSNQQIKIIYLEIRNV